jgi:hypothetical protein
MDADEEKGKAKSWIIGLAILLVGGYFAIGELRYLAFGRTAEASITRAFDVTERGRGGRERPKLEIRYEFTDADGLVRVGGDRVDPDAGYPRSGTVPVRYLSGQEGKVRLGGNINWVAIVAFLGVLGVMGLAVARVAIEERRTRPARKPASGPYARRR